LAQAARGLAREPLGQILFLELLLQQVAAAAALQIQVPHLRQAVLEVVVLRLMVLAQQVHLVKEIQAVQQAQTAMAAVEALEP
jgi:ABC-type transport system involved in cytochrome c biogenesis permease subunit